MKSKLQYGDFGPIYDQFKDKPREAILWLKKVKKGECPQALYRKDIGYIDIVWGENDPVTNKGYGLKHIIEKHGKEIKELGYNVEDFVPIIFLYGNLNLKKSIKNKIFIEGSMFRIVILTKWNGKKKRFVLTAFDLRKKNRPPLKRSIKRNK